MVRDCGEMAVQVSALNERLMKSLANRFEVNMKADIRPRAIPEAMSILSPRVAVLLSGSRISISRLTTNQTSPSKGDGSLLPLFMGFPLPPSACPKPRSYHAKRCPFRPDFSIVHDHRNGNASGGL